MNIGKTYKAFRKEDEPILARCVPADQMGPFVGLPQLSDNLRGAFPGAELDSFLDARTMRLKDEWRGDVKLVAFETAQSYDRRSFRTELRLTSERDAP